MWWPTCNYNTCTRGRRASFLILLMMGAWRPKHVEWLCRNKTCTVLHQVGVLLDLHYDARKHKSKVLHLAVTQVAVTFVLICVAMVSFVWGKGKEHLMWRPRGTRWRSWLMHCATKQKSRVRFSMVSLEFFIDIIFPAALWLLDWLSL